MPMKGSKELSSRKGDFNGRHGWENGIKLHKHGNLFLKYKLLKEEVESVVHTQKNRSPAPDTVKEI